MALIPGRAADSAFVQVVTNNRAYNIQYPLSEYRGGDILRVAGNTFSPFGIALDIRHPDLTLTGEIKYDNLAPINGDIMGPFRFFPMECRHAVISMRHSLLGAVELNGEIQDFSGGVGYIESDSGRSFPQSYTWVQCNDFREDCSIMSAVAKIPFYGLKFWGCICVVWLNGREYRLATYNGVKIRRCEPGAIQLERGKYKLTATIDMDSGHMLPAPRFGKMSRMICESLSIPARFRFTEKDRVLFDGKGHTSYEYEMP